MAPYSYITGSTFFKLTGFALIASGLYFLFFPAKKAGTTDSWQRKILGLGVLLLGLLLPAVIPSPGVAWSNYNEGLLESARLQNRPVALDFYAAWCVPCLQMERYTFSDPRVVREMDRFIRLKADVTDMKSDLSQKILKKYGIQSLPVLLFFDGSTEEIPDSRVEGFLEPDELLFLLQDPRLKS